MRGHLEQHAVVIAGGGPTGLMLAAELALAGVDAVIVERRATQELASARAGGLHARTLEVLDQRGVVDRFLERGQRMQIVSFLRGHILDLGDFPTRHNYGLALWQRHIERLLAEWVAELGVPTLRGRELVDFATDETGVDVVLAGGAVLRAHYLVGCDGGRSLVRKKAGVAFPGWEASTSYLIAEVELSEVPPYGVRRGARGVYALGKHEDGQRTGVVLVEDEVGGGDEPTLDELRAALIAVYGRDFGLRSASYLSRFSDLARQAASYRAGRVLLAGDAAHVHSPVGGQGLNTGVQDAVNLGWKLAQVVRGTAPDSLLDTYHAERHPVGARVLRTTLAMTALDRGDDRTEALREQLAVLMRMDEPRRRYAGQLSGLDIAYDLGGDHPLVGRRMPDLELAGGDRVYRHLHRARPLLLNLGAPLELSPWADRVPVLAAAYTGPWSLPVLGTVPAPTAVLIRPDGHVAWVGDGTDAGLHSALTAWFGPRA